MFVQKLKTRWCETQFVYHGSLDLIDLIVMISKGKQQFHTLLAGYFVTFGKFMGNPICHANVNRICLKGPTFQVLTHPKDLSVLQPQTKARLYQRSGILKKMGVWLRMTIWYHLYQPRKYSKVTILSKNEPTGTAHVSTTSLPNFWIFWISHENKKRRQHALARRVLRSIQKNMAV